MNHIRLNGNWTQGWAISLHTLHSTLIPSSQISPPRSTIGESLYQLKYCQDYTQIDHLAKRAIEFLKSQNITSKLSAIIPTPPSSKRNRQPVHEIAKKMADALNIFFDSSYIEKLKDTPQLKSVQKAIDREHILQNTFHVDPARYDGKKVLIFDDLYRSGSTLK